MNAVKIHIGAPWMRRLARVVSVIALLGVPALAFTFLGFPRFSQALAETDPDTGEFRIVEPLLSAEAGRAAPRTGVNGSQDPIGERIETLGNWTYTGRPSIHQ